MKPRIESTDPKTIGAFYTPPTVADMLADWVVQAGDERILEPSVGAGALIAACEKAAIRKTTDLQSSIKYLACDINPEAIDSVRASGQPRIDLRAVDFLQLDPAGTGKFGAVIANPPFTRNHQLEPKLRENLRNHFRTSGAVGLWVHFLFHSMSFLRSGARLAFVVPGSALFTVYGQKALMRVYRSFSAVELRQFVDKPFWTNGASERGALILAEGFGGSCEVPKPSRWTAAGASVPTNEQNDALRTLNSKTVALGEIAKISIGAVTGCNQVFLLTEAERFALGIPHEDVKLMVTRARQLPGLQISKNRLFKLDQPNERIWMLAPRNLVDRNTGVRQRLASISKDKRNETLWFSKRSPWWRVETGSRPDGIFTYMNDTGPRLALVRGDVRCTNTLHAVRFSRDLSQNDRQAVSLSLITSYGALAAEKLGRVYGGGLLKFELIDARRLPIFLPKIDLRTAYRKADLALRAGDESSARLIADQALIEPILGRCARMAVDEMKSELRALRWARTGRSEL